MIYHYSDIIKKEKNERKARTAIKANKYIKVAPGLYSDSSRNESYLELIFKRYKNVIITMQTAFEYYGLTDFNNDKYTVVFPHGSRKVLDSNIQQLFQTKKIFDIGRTKLLKNNTEIYIYDKERLLIELIRNKKKIPFDYYKEIINSYRDLVKDGKIDTNLIMEYSRYFKNGDAIVEKIIEVVS